MASNIKKRFTVSLDIDVKTAEQQVKSTVGNIKKILSDLGNATDKMGYFKELVDYISQIDTALTALKTKNADVFDGLFDGLDADLRKVMESIFNTSKESMSALDGLRQKINEASTSGAGVKELRKIAEEINSLFTGLGAIPPIDLDKQFTGRGKTADRVKVLSDALDNFAVVWSNVHNKIKGGFGFEGTGASAGFSGISDQVRHEVDQLEKQVERYKDIVKQIGNLTKIINSAGDKTIKLDFKETEESAKRLVDLFKELDNKHQEFLNNGDTESVAYYENIVKRAEAAMKILELDERMTKRDNSNNVTKESPKFLHDIAKSDDIQYAIEDLPDLAKEMRYAFEAAITSTKKQIEQVKNNALDGVKKQVKDKTGVSTSGQSKSHEDGTITNIDFTDLKNTIQSEAATLASKLDNVLKVELVQDDTNIQGAIDGVRGIVEKISGAIDNYNALKEASAKQAEIDVVKANLTQLLKYVSDFNARQIDGQYQQQELSASLLSDGSISMGYGEKGAVPWNRVASNLIANLSKSLIMDIHSHPLHKVQYGSDTYVSDAFSGSTGDLAAFRFSKQLGAQVSAMITGNVLRTLDLSKLTDNQMAFLSAALSEVEKRYVKDDRYKDYIGQNANGDLFYRRQTTQEGQHRVTQIFESMMYDAFADIGLSKDFVDNEVFRKYDLTNEQQLTEAAEKMVQLSSAAQSTVSPMQRLAEVISMFRGDSISPNAQSVLQAFEKGELSAADAFNRLTPSRFHVNQDTLDSLYKIDTANEISTVESLLTQISGILNTISTSVSGIENNTRQSTQSQLDAAMNDIIDLRSGMNTGRLTAGVQSIYDPLNISKYKNREVLAQADNAVLEFKDLLHDVYMQSRDDGEVDVDFAKIVFEKFQIAMANVQDALRQINLYEDRTGQDFYDNNEFASATLGEKYNELIEPINLDKMLALLSQAKIQLNDLKRDHNGGMNTDLDEAEVGNIDLVIGALQSIQAMLESIYGVLHGFTGIEADTKNAVKYSKPIDETAATSRSFSDQDFSVLNSILQSVQDINAFLHTDNIDEVAEKPENINKEQLEQSSIYQLLASKLPGNVASEDTLSSVRDLLAQLVTAATAQDETTEDDNSQVQESLGQLVVTLTSAVKGLQDATNGIIQHQKATKTDTSVANARIADKESYSQIKSVALNSLGDRALDGEVTEMKALANGIVQVIGYLQVAENEWEGFTLQVNEANEVSKLAFDKNSKAAKRAAAEAEALRKASTLGKDDNKKAYSKEETARRAQVHLDEYTEQGKNATVQLKDSGRYTISILEEIGGLSKQIFQTFDENDDKIERTTATMSNKTLVKLQQLQRMIDLGNKSGLVGDADDSYQKYIQAVNELNNMNDLYKDQDTLSDTEISNWNTQIKLVQQLGAEVEKLVLKRKTAASSAVFASEKSKEASIFNNQYEDLKQSIAIPESFSDRINTIRNKFTGAIDKDSLTIAKNEWAALRAEIEATAKQQDLFIKKSKSSQTTKKSEYGTTPIVNARAKFNTLSGRAQSYIDDGSVVVADAMREYEDAFRKLIALQEKFKDGQDPTAEQKAQFIQLKNECNEYGNALKKVLDSSDKLSNSGFNSKTIKSDISLDGYEDRARALREYVTETYGARANIKGLNSDATELTFTFRNADGAIDTMTASLNAARTTIVTTAQGTKQASSVLGEMWNKFKGLGKYAMARFGVDEVFQAIRSGIQDVREIDSALTELKKVTDETGGAYDRFLQNMSKTAGVVGSTVADLTTMAAEWARLGYNMEESGQLAENTAILLNVSEFESATEASEALISTMQANITCLVA